MNNWISLFEWLFHLIYYHHYLFPSVARRKCIFRWPQIDFTNERFAGTKFFRCKVGVSVGVHTREPPGYALFWYILITGVDCWAARRLVILCLQFGLIWSNSRTCRCQDHNASKATALTRYVRFMAAWAESPTYSTQGIRSGWINNRPSGRVVAYTSAS